MKISNRKSLLKFLYSILSQKQLLPSKDIEETPIIAKHGNTIKEADYLNIIKTKQLISDSWMMLFSFGINDVCLK